MHQFQNQEQSVRFYRSQVLSITDHNLGDANLARSAQGLMQNRVSFLAAFLWLQEIRLIEVLWVDLFQLDEVGDVDGMRRFDPNLFEVLFLHDNVTAALVLEAFHDMAGRDLFGVSLRDFLVFDWAKIAGTQLPKTNLFFARSGINRHWNVNQPKTDAAFPDRTHITGMLLFHASVNVSNASRLCARCYVLDTWHTSVGDAVRFPTTSVITAPSATFELPCKFRKRSDVELGYESHCDFYEFGRSGFDRYPADRSRLVWCKEITRARAGNGASCEGISKGKG